MSVVAGSARLRAASLTLDQTKVDGEASARPHYPKELRRLPLVERPGDYKLPDAAYRADPCPLPSLNPTLAIDLLSRSPLHAATEHPRIGKPVEPARLDFDLGRAAHAVLLEGDTAILPIDADDYRTNAAKAAREFTFAGLTPCRMRAKPGAFFCACAMSFGRALISAFSRAAGGRLSSRS